MYQRLFKRMIDFTLSLIGLIVLLPLFLIISIIIKITSPGPIFFKQKRVGIHKTYFNILKYYVLSPVRVSKKTFNRVCALLKVLLPQKGSHASFLQRMLTANFQSYSPITFIIITNFILKVNIFLTIS